MLRISKADCGVEAEPLRAPFGFKGKNIDILWQSAVCLQDADGAVGCAPGVQSVVWSDAEVFERFGQSGGNAAMYLITCFALDLVRGQSFENPVDMIHQILEPLTRKAQEITGMPNLRQTFILNALVALDLAAWQLYARKQCSEDFLALLTPSMSAALSHRHQLLANVPLISYNVPIDNVEKLVQSGSFLLKIKLGCDPDHDNDRAKMLQGDIARIKLLHETLKEYRTPFTDNAKLAYYFDANGRYDNLERLMRLMDHLDKIDALEQTVLFEEPFAENSGIDVHGIPVRVAADESAHCALDSQALMDLGYTAIALKPIAKTLSISLEIARLAYTKGIPCFCADLTVNPLMVDWNKNVACRLGVIPGLKIGALESNGNQNYPEWERLCAYHPIPKAGWIDMQNGLFELNNDFYQTSGGVFRDSSHYLQLARKG